VAAATPAILARRAAAARIIRLGIYKLTRDPSVIIPTSRGE